MEGAPESGLPYLARSAPFPQQLPYRERSTNRAITAHAHFAADADTNPLPLSRGVFVTSRHAQKYSVSLWKGFSNRSSHIWPQSNSKPKSPESCQNLAPALLGQDFTCAVVPLDTRILDCTMI